MGAFWGCFNYTAGVPGYNEDVCGDANKRVTTRVARLIDISQGSVTMALQSLHLREKCTISGRKKSKFPFWSESNYHFFPLKKFYTTPTHYILGETFR